MQLLITTCRIFLLVSVASSFQLASPRRLLDRLVIRLNLAHPADDDDDAFFAISRSERKKLKQLQSYERRRDLWVERYGSCQALQATFGKGPRWGDLSPEQTRRLYHTLLPRTLLGLYEMGVMKPDELAPLAYEARIAAKEYARSRCVWTGRLATAIFDQYRNIRYHGRFASKSIMSWEYIWQKYEAQIVEEEGEKSVRDKDDLTMRIYLRILERSVETNKAFDSLFLKETKNDEDDEYLEIIANDLEADVRAILLEPKDHAKVIQKEEKVRKKLEKAKGKEEKRQRDIQQKQQKELEKVKAKEEKRRRDMEHKQQKRLQKAKRKAKGDGTTNGNS